MEPGQLEGQPPAALPLRDLYTTAPGPVDQLWYGRVRAVAPDSGPMNQVIRRYKYGVRKAWAQILGRVLLGYLDEHAEEFNEYDMIIPMPAYTGPGAHRSGRTLTSSWNAPQPRTRMAGPFATSPL